VVKIIAELLKYLPAEYNYKIIFMRRNIDEIILSQQKMAEVVDPNLYRSKT